MRGKEQLQQQKKLQQQKITKLPPLACDHFFVQLFVYSGAFANNVCGFYLKKT